MIAMIEPSPSIIDLDPRSITTERGQSFQRTADASFLPETCHMSDDEHIPAVDAHLDRARAVAERIANLLLDPALDDRVCLGLGSGFTQPFGRSAARRIAGPGRGRLAHDPA
jgi:hypothetical protein